MSLYLRGILLASLSLILLESGCRVIPIGTGKNTEEMENTSPVAVSLGTPVGSYEILSGKKSVSIPFEMFRGDIRMLAQINGRDCHFLVDNGSLWDELLFFGSPKIDSLNLEITGVTVLGDTAVENPIYADVAENISIAFGDLVFRGQPGIITRYIAGLPNPWEGADGQISAAFFKNFVVAINFDESIITLTRPDQFTYQGTGQAVTMHHGPHSSRTITASIMGADGEKLTLELLVDLGGIYPLYLSLGSDDRITLPPNAEEAVLGIGFGPNQGYLGRISQLTIGDYTLENVLTAFTPMAEGASVFGNTMVGMPLLQHFNLVFDYFNDRLFLEPNRSFNNPF